MTHVCECLVCGHIWTSRVEDPLKCPKCGSYDWVTDIQDVKPTKRPKLTKDAQRMKKCSDCGIWQSMRNAVCRFCGSAEFLRRPVFV
ncbi:hypothetical protein LCGC14_2908150, partial [marine sediment metagenome]